MRKEGKDEMEDDTFCTHTQINALNNIHKRFILLILYIPPSPTRYTRCLTCDFWWFFLFRRCDEAISRYEREGKGRRTTAMFVETMLSVVIYVFKVSISLFWGYPKSFISIARLSTSITLETTSNWPSMSSYITTKLFFTDSSSILPKYALQILMKR